MARPITKPSRGIGTLIGNGWLREAPKNVIPRGWDIRGRSALRKCLFLPAPDPPFRAPHVVATPLPPPQPARREIPIEPPRRDPKKWARMLPVVDPARVAAPPRPTGAWYEDPVALGTLLLLVPPVGLAALWSSRRYSSDARWALTIMTALTMCLIAAVALVLRFA